MELLLKAFSNIEENSSVFEWAGFYQRVTAETGNREKKNEGVSEMQMLTLFF